MPKAVGSIGFPMVAASARSGHAVGVPDGRHRRLAAHVARRQAGGVSARVNGGKTWQRQATGLPKAQAWWTVKRQAMTRRPRATRSGVYFGTTRGEVWGSRDEGAQLAVRSRRTCRTSTRSKRSDDGAHVARSGDDRHVAHSRRRCAPTPTARRVRVGVPLLAPERRRRWRRARRARRAAIPASASASSTSRARSARTSRSSSTASSRDDLRAPVPRATR